MSTYHFISDLHIGGDEALGVCEFEEELIGYLDELASDATPEDELIIVGDAFGLWEFTNVEGADKLQTLIDQFPGIFQAFRDAGRSIRITLMAGNHDYELACYEQFVDALRTYNINLVQTYSITRDIGGRRLWIEHGSQQDPANRVADYGNPYAQPVGYYITANFVGGAGQVSERGRYNWLKDIQSVYPTEEIPNWVISNYFYKEMSPLLRWIALPFLLLFGVTLVVFAGAFLEAIGATESNIFLKNRVIDSLGFVGSVFQVIVSINMVLIAEVLILAVPVWLLVKDIRRTARRFGLDLDPAEVTGQKEEGYLDAAEGVFRSDPKVVAFIYGHTHAPSVRRVGDRVVINTGTWIKQLTPTKVRIGVLPRVYVPSYQLSSFRIGVVADKIVVEYHQLRKQPRQELTLLQRSLIWRRKAPGVEPVPGHTELPAFETRE